MYKNILIDDIIFSLQKTGGISVVWYEMIKRLLNEDDLYIQFIDFKENNNKLRLKLGISKDQILKINSYNFLQRYSNPVIKKEKPFIFHSSYYRTCSNKLSTNITTVHDFTYEFFIRGLKRKIHSYQKFNAIRNSKYIVCVSENTKSDLLQFLPDIEAERIIVIPNGVSDDFFILNENNVILENHFLEKDKYLLFIGSRTSYKNFDIAVKACSKSNFKLVVVGSSFTPEEIRFMQKHIDQENVINAGRVSNESLNRLYNNAYALLYPSSYEGFGIPVLEAQRSGCPVIAYNKSSIPEVIGDKTLLIDELNEEVISNKLELLEDSYLRKTIINNGLENSKKYSWDNTYSKLMSLYNKVWKEIQ